MERPRFLRDLTRTLLHIVVLIGTALWSVHWLAFRVPSADWRYLLVGLLLAAGLGWWPWISLGVAAVLAALSALLVEDPEMRMQVPQDIAVFWALGLGWGVIARGWLRPESLKRGGARPDETSLRLQVLSGPRRTVERLPTRASEGSGSVPPGPGALRPPPPVVPDGYVAPLSEFERGNESTGISRANVWSAPPPVRASSPPAPPPLPSPLPPVVPLPVRSPPPPEVAARPAMPPPVPSPTRSAPPPPPAPRPVRPPPGMFDPPPEPNGAFETLLDPAASATSAMPFEAVAATTAVPFEANPALKTQEVDLAGFREFVARQDAAPPAPLPVNPIAQRESSAVPKPPAPPASLQAEPVRVPGSSSGSFRPPPGAVRPETDPGASYETLLSWYNQFGWAPWSARELEKRYARPGTSWEAFAQQEVIRTWKVWRSGARPMPTASGAVRMEVLEGFLRCEQLGLLRWQGFSDLHVLTQVSPGEAWFSVYREVRGRLRGGEPILRRLAPDQTIHDPSRALEGRPDALVEVQGDCDVVAFVTPFSASESLTWAPAYAMAQKILADRLGVSTSMAVVATLPLPYWDERKQPRILPVESPEGARRVLDSALERLLRVLRGETPPRVQGQAAVCNGCGWRHHCPSYAGTRPRLDLSDPPPFIRGALG